MRRLSVVTGALFFGFLHYCLRSWESSFTGWSETAPKKSGSRLSKERARLLMKAGGLQSLQMLEGASGTPGEDAPVVDASASEGATESEDGDPDVAAPPEEGA